MVEDRPFRMEVIDDADAEVLRRMNPAARVAMIDVMHQFGRDILRSQIRRLHPEWPDSRCEAEVSRRLLTDATD
jgi:hypothetical protein